MKNLNEIKINGVTIKEMFEVVEMYHDNDEKAMWFKGIVEHFITDNRTALDEDLVWLAYKNMM